MSPVDRSTHLQPPLFPERQHPIVSALEGYDDLELLVAFQQYPSCGRYFVALFCRYGALLHTLVARSATTIVQVDYLFAMSWRHIFYELRGLDPHQLEATGTRSLRSWLVEMVGVCARCVTLPPPGAIRYDLSTAPPPLWCHLEGALDDLLPLERVVLLLTQSTGWTLEQVADRIAADTSESPSLTTLETSLHSARQRLERSLPSDLREIYLSLA
ncbi:MAG: sigma-70 family RNA polymerase sigma factor [Cyanobacteria bacterium J06641_5]